MLRVAFAMRDRQQRHQEERETSNDCNVNVVSIGEECHGVEDAGVMKKEQ